MQNIKNILLIIYIFIITLFSFGFSEENKYSKIAKECMNKTDIDYDILKSVYDDFKLYDEYYLYIQGTNKVISFNFIEDIIQFIKEAGIHKKCIIYYNKGMNYFTLMEDKWN